MSNLSRRELPSRLRYYADHANELTPDVFRMLATDLLREAADALDANKTPLINDAPIESTKAAKDDRPQTLFGVPIKYSDKPEVKIDAPILTVLPSILLDPKRRELWDRMMNNDTAQETEDN